MRKRKFYGQVAIILFAELLLATFLLTALSFNPPPGFVGAPAASSVAEPDNGDWQYVDHDLNGTRYSPLNQITSRNVKHLGKVCSYSFPEKMPAQTAPIVSAGVLYLTTAHYTVALDGFNCQVLWTHKWEPHDIEPFKTHRGAAIADGKIIRGTSDDFLIALDARDGRLLWAKQIANPHEGNFISMPPLVHGELVYIGPAGSEWASSGWVGAFHVNNGEQVWKFNIVPADGEPGAETWGPDPAARKHAGGNLWTPLSYDLERDLLYVPGGNPAPDFYDDARPGANLYTNSIIALDAKTGRLAWYVQFLPHDVHDYDLTHVSPIFKANIGGVSRTAIATSGKDGLLRVVDRDTHKILYSVPFATRLNADAPMRTTPTRVCPGALGGNEWNGSAYSPRLHLLVIPSTDNWCYEEKKNTAPPSSEEANVHGRYFGGEPGRDKYSNARGRVTGFDASTGKERWHYEAPTPTVAGVTVTAADLVFTGEIGGYFVALGAQSGKILFRYNLGDPIQGGVVCYAAHNIQHVAVVSGFGGIHNIVAPEIGGGNPTVTIFRLQKK